PRPGGRDEGVRPGERGDAIGRGVVRQLDAVDLVDVEYPRRARDAAHAGARVAGFVGRGFDLDRLEEHDRRRRLAAADLAAELPPLAVGGPERAGMTTARGRGPQGENVDAAVAAAG